MARLMPAQRQALLASSWFAAWPAPARDEALELALLRHLQADEVLYAKGRAAEAWYGVVGGAIRLGTTAPDGRQGLVAFIEPGAWFGDTSLFDGLPRPHDAVAHGDAVVLALAAGHFADLLERYPVLYRHFIALHCRRARLMFLALEAWTTFPLAERLARYLLNLAEGHGQREGAAVAINLHLPQEQLAQLLGVSRQRIGQILHDWEQQGHVHVRYGRIVLDGAWLATWARAEAEAGCGLALSH